METAINLISNVGFPIGAFCLMWNFATKTLKESTEAIKNSQKEATEAIKNLTIMIKAHLGK